MIRLLIVCLSSFASTAITAAEIFDFRHDNVLGTSLEIKVDAETAEAALQVEQTVLGEIDRLALVYSTYSPDSELSKWLASPKVPTKVSKELLQLMQLSEDARRKTHGAFDVRVAGFCELWSMGAQADRVPSAAQLNAILDHMKQPVWEIDAAQVTAHRLADTKLTVDGIAKGMIVDAACEAAMQVTNTRGIMVNIGGDLRVLGSLNQQVQIANPALPSEMVDQFALANAAIATSGNYFKFYTIGGKQYSHIIDPRSGLPVQHVVSSTVIAENAAMADVLATAFSVLSIEESLALCDQLPGVACMLITQDGVQKTGGSWPGKSRTTKLVSEKESSPNNNSENAAEQWPDGAETKVSFEINRPNGNRYRRPYVAVWIEDDQEKPVRTLSLWLQTERPGPRWHRDLKRWYKQDSARRETDNTNLIGTISAATKPPGKYDVLWDGKSDHGELVKQGHYTLYIESAREHGPYEIMSAKIQVGREAVQGDLGTNAEFKSATFEYAPTGFKK